MKELLYIKIADIIKEDIRCGRLRPGMRLAGVRELAAEWKTSPNTILKALGILEQEKFVRKTQGQGIFVEPGEFWSGNIGAEIELLIYDMTPPFNMALVRAIEKVASDYGYRLAIKSLGKTKEDSGMKLAGRIIIPESAALLPVSASGSDIPTVFIGEFSPPDDFSYNYAIADTYAGFYRAAGMLIEMGRERIAYIGGSGKLETEPGWYACRDVLSGSRSGFRREYAVTAGGWSAESGQAAMENILLSGEYPDGLICSNDTLAAGACKACRAVGLNIPEDIAVIGAGDQDIAPLLDPPLTSLRYPAAVIGLTAVNFIKAKESGIIGEDELIKARFDIEIVQRGSTPVPGDDETEESLPEESVWL